MEESSVEFTSIEKKVFTEHNGVFYIGGEALTPQMRDLLREQAKYLQTSQLWETLNATITDEASNLALIQSTNFDQVLSAKMLHHWNHVLKNMIFKLAK